MKHISDNVNKDDAISQEQEGARYLATQKTAVSEFPEEESKEESAYHEDQRQKRGVGLVNDVFNVSPIRRGRVF